MPSPSDIEIAEWDLAQALTCPRRAAASIRDELGKAERPPPGHQPKAPSVRSVMARAALGSALENSTYTARNGVIDNAALRRSAEELCEEAPAVAFAATDPDRPAHVAAMGALKILLEIGASQLQEYYLATPASLHVPVGPDSWRLNVRASSPALVLPAPGRAKNAGKYSIVTFRIGKRGKKPPAQSVRDWIAVGCRALSEGFLMDDAQALHFDGERLSKTAIHQPTAIDQVRRAAMGLWQALDTGGAPRPGPHCGKCSDLSCPANLSYDPDFSEVEE